MKIAAVASTTPEPVSEQDRLGSVALDQWRGVALVLVLVSHGFFYTDRVNGIGRVGVNLFFFISGILVFRSLSRTRAVTARDRARSFWWRRLRRLYPAMLTYTLAMMPVAWLMQNHPGQVGPTNFQSYLRSLPVVLLYGINYVTWSAPMILRHLWSLACEMQFYFLAPIIYWLGGQTDRRRSRFFGSLLVILMMAGAAQPFIGRWHPNFWQYNFEFAVWPMMLGYCCEYKRVALHRIPPTVASWMFWLTIVVCGACLGLSVVYANMKIVVIAAGALLLAPCLLAYLFGRPMCGLLGRAMKWAGERTYSIYLWQQPFTLCNFLPNPWHPAGAAMSVAVGGAWFHFFERPFLSAGRRHSTQDTSRTKRTWRRWSVAVPAICLTAGFLAFWVVRERYERHLQQQIWPGATLQVNPISSAPGGSEPTVLLLGDSRIVQWGLPQIAHWRVVNAGVGGATTGQIRLLTPGILSEVHPDIVVLEAGINDLKFIGLRPEMSTALVELAASNVVAIVNECVRQRCKVVVVETWPAGNPSLARRWVWSARIPAAVNDLNRRLEVLDTPQRGVVVVDLFGKAGVTPDAGSYVNTLHFTPETYSLLTPALEKELNAMLFQ